MPPKNRQQKNAAGAPEDNSGAAGGVQDQQAEAMVNEGGPVNPGLSSDVGDADQPGGNIEPPAAADAETASAVETETGLKFPLVVRVTNNTNMRLDLHAVGHRALRSAEASVDEYEINVHRRSSALVKCDSVEALDALHQHLTELGELRQWDDEAVTVEPITE